MQKAILLSDLGQFFVDFLYEAESRWPYIFGQNCISKGDVRGGGAGDSGAGDGH